MKIGRSAIGLLAGLCLACEAQNPYPWQGRYDTLNSVALRITPPAGMERISIEPGSFAAWLRYIPLKPGRPPVHLFNGQLKHNQEAHTAVVDIDVGRRDLQQCADAVLRLRAEYLWSAGIYDQIAFTFSSGDRAAWTAWRDGLRPIVRNNRVRFAAQAAHDESRACFEAYLQSLFTYANTASLARDLMAVDPFEPIQIGDVFVQGGYPGHAVLVVDVAQATDSEHRAFLLVQSYMPAQEIHVLRHPNKPLDDPWYLSDAGAMLITPEWTFAWSDRKRFSEPN
ncbi:MAG: DUF4846 domain-containing protein [Vicinamibacteria bacterium]|jgi:hypothetical protein|nr:DUF4846 domain-containing protein [Vicinamibacteria bacterium]